MASRSPDSFELTKRRREVIEGVMGDIDKASEVLTRWMYKTQPFWTRVRANLSEIGDSISTRLRPVFDAVYPLLASSARQ
jgi:hypothetical protein